MPNWLRRLISAIIALLILAVTYPDVLLQGRVLTGLFVCVLFLSVFPFLLVCIFTGRSESAEIVGWCLQLFFLVSVFMR